jgi:hypothetical protein
MEWVESMAFDDTWPTKKRLSQTISTSIVWFIHWASTADLLCLAFSPSFQADQFQKIILDVSHPGTYRVVLGKELNQITIRGKETNNLSFELLELSVFVLSVFVDREDWRRSGGWKSETSTTL